MHACNIYSMTYPSSLPWPASLALYPATYHLHSQPSSSLSLIKIKVALCSTHNHVHPQAPPSAPPSGRPSHLGQLGPSWRSLGSIEDCPRQRDGGELLHGASGGQLHRQVPVICVRSSGGLPAAVGLRCLAGGVTYVVPRRTVEKLLQHTGLCPAESSGEWTTSLSLNDTEIRKNMYVYR